jgi:hypothetical protein
MKIQKLLDFFEKNKSVVAVSELAIEDLIKSPEKVLTFHVLYSREKGLRLQAEIDGAGNITRNYEVLELTFFISTYNGERDINFGFSPEHSVISRPDIQEWINNLLLL